MSAEPRGLPVPSTSTSLTDVIRSSAGSFFAFFVRDFRTASSYRLTWVAQFVAAAFGFTSYYFMGRFVRPDTSLMSVPTAGGYFAFVAVGIALSNLLLVALRAGASSLRDEMAFGTLEHVLLTGLAPWRIVAGSSVWGICFTGLQSLLILGAATVFSGGSAGTGVLLVAAACALTILAALGLGMMVCALTMVVKRGDSLVWFLGEAMTLLSGVYYPVDVLPAPLRLLSDLTPLAPALRIARRVLLSDAPGSDGLGDLALAGLLATVYLAAGAAVFHRGLQIARREGSLGQV